MRGEARNLTAAEYHDQVHHAMTEATLQKQCELALRELGAYCYHTRDSRKSSPGYPDLTVITQDGRIGWFELKTESGKLTRHQDSWLARCKKAGVTVAVIRPRHYDWLISWARGEI